MAKRVLVIDDDAQDRELVATILEAAGYVVRCAEGATSGLALAEVEPPDVVILDLQLPEMDGYEVCRSLRLRPATRRVPVVMVTASDDPALNRKAFAAGAQACVPKPFRREGLTATIEAALAAMRREKPQAD
jgi:CheY-like chemotaxis protein